MKKILNFCLLLMLGCIPLMLNKNLQMQALGATNWDSEYALIRVNGIGERLLIGNSLPRNVKFKVSSEDHVNAYATISKEILISREILETVGEDDDELAAVLSHEIGHIVNAHAKKHLAIKTGLVVASEVGASYIPIKGASVLGQINRYSPIPISVSSATGTATDMVYNKISREDEFEADLTGIDILANADYNPLAMISMLNKISGNYFDFTSTHPSGERRIMNAYDYISYNYPNALKTGYNSISYERALKIINANIAARDSYAKQISHKKQTKMHNDKLERSKTLKKIQNDPWLLNAQKSEY